MSLPLNDPTNPLYGLEPAEQCRVLEKQGVAIPPERLFSLSGSYDNQALKKAYRQLSLRLHPDKNAEVKEAHTAFQLLTDAYNYLEFKLDSHGDVSSGMKNNPYYKAYAEIAPVFKYDLEKMEYQYKSLLKIITEAKAITPEQITLVKYYISLNKSLLDCVIYRDEIRILAVKYSDVHFVSWLLAQGTVSESLWEGMLYQALSNAKPNIFKRLCDSLGPERLSTTIVWLHSQFAYEESTETLLGTLLFYTAIEYNQLESMRYLLENMGYRKHLNEGAANSRIVNSKKPCSFSRAPLYIYLREHHLLSSRQCFPWSYREGTFLLYAVVNEDMSLWRYIMDNDAAEIELTDLLFYYYEALEKHPDNSELVGRLLTTLKARIVSFSELRELISHHFNDIIKRADLLPYLYSSLLAYQEPSAEKKEREFQRSKLSEKELEEIHTSIDGATRQEKVEKHLNEVIDRLRSHLIDASLEAFQAAALHRNYEVFKQLDAISDKPLYFEITWSFWLHVVARARNEINCPAFKIASTLVQKGIKEFFLCQSNANYGIYDNKHSYLSQDPLFSSSKRCLYTPLHVTIENGLTGLSLQLADKMIETQCSLDLRCHRIERKKVQSDDGWESTLHSYYTPLHMAIEQNHEALALKLIEAGADYRAKSVIKTITPNQAPPSFFSQAPQSFFSKNTYRVESPLEMAVRFNRPQVIRALQIKMNLNMKIKLVEEYIDQRQREGVYLSKFNVCGFRFQYGLFHKNRKLHAAQQLLEALKRGETSYYLLNLRHFGAVLQGRLGAIAQLSSYEEETNSNETLSFDEEHEIELSYKR